MSLTKRVNWRAVWVAPVLFSALGGTARAQQSGGGSAPVSQGQVDQFEEVAPPIEEVGGKRQKTTFQEKEGLPGELGDAFKFEEFRPSIEELRVTTPGSGQGSSGSGMPTSGATPEALPTTSGSSGGMGGLQTSGPLPAVAVDPRQRAAPVPSIPPLETAMPGAGAAMPVVPMTAGAAQSVALPSRGLSLDDDFSADLKVLQQRMAQLKERVIETKSRLLNYGQKVARGFAAGTEILVLAVNELGGDYRVERLVVNLDGHQVYARDYDLENDQNLEERVEIYKGSILPGRHRVDIELFIQGDDGAFDFGYSARMRMEAGEYFTANEGKTIQVALDLYDLGGWFKEAEERPALKFDIIEKDVF